MLHIKSISCQQIDTNKSLEFSPSTSNSRDEAVA